MENKSNGKSWWDSLGWKLDDSKKGKWMLIVGAGVAIVSVGYITYRMYARGEGSKKAREKENTTSDAYIGIDSYEPLNAKQQTKRDREDREPKNYIRFIDENGMVRLGEDLGNGVARLITGSLLSSHTLTDEILPYTQRMAPVEPSLILLVDDASHKNNHRDAETKHHLSITPRRRRWRPQRSVRTPRAAVERHSAQAQETKRTGFDAKIMAPRTLIGSGETIVIPEGVEAKATAHLGVVIGRDCKGVSAEDANDYVLGYVVALNVRVTQKNCGRGDFWQNQLDKSCAIGPILLPKKMADLSRMRVSLYLNDEILQDFRVPLLSVAVSQLIASLSKDTTLPAGTLILTGITQNDALNRTRVLHGDVLTTVCQGIGTIRNQVAVNGRSSDVKALTPKTPDKRAIHRGHCASTTVTEDST